MRMKKENMDHIRERFENETGVKLTEKAGFEMPAWTGRMLAAAAGLLCLVGLGLAWHKVSIDKQASAEMLLAGAEDGQEASIEETEETEEAPATEPEEADPEAETPDAETGDNGSEEEDPDFISADALVERNLNLYLTVDEAKELVAARLFGPETNWTWPVSNSEDRVILSDATGSGDPDRYLSICGTVGDEVVAMNACTVTEIGFNVERGNYIITEAGDLSIIYSHLDEICVSEGAQLNAGDKIGTLGNTGASTGPHLGIEASDSIGCVLEVIDVDGSFYSEEVIEE
ncbi:MAG: M23 family metallopeptidase [Lachnospiraceae bacterium]|nr:M23 family metallopeptidase [Lachnospiraceae bacterium]